MKLTRYPSERRELTGPGRLLLFLATFIALWALMVSVH